MAKKIHIKKKNRGKLHEDLNIPKGEKIPASKLKVKSTDSPAVKKRKVFASNARKWSKGQDGFIIPKQEDFPDVESFHAALDAYNASITDMMAQQELQLIPGVAPNNNPLQTSTSRFQDVFNQTPSVQQSFQNRDLSQPASLAAPKSKKKKFNWGNAALTALAVTNAVIPKDIIKPPVVQPAQSYNPHPYGTGSQALANDGKKIKGKKYISKSYNFGGDIPLSVDGYKNNSMDRDQPMLRIPSGDITMNNVPHPVLGIDSLGNQQLMMPEGNYQFPGEYVDEIPLAKKGKKMKKKKPGKYISTSYEEGGKMRYANKGLHIEDNAFTPISDSVLKINGESHENGGTKLAYAGKGVEAEAGETFHIDQEGNGVIMGNMQNPLTGRKFKQDSKMLANKEKKIDKLLDYSTELVNTSNPYDKWDVLKFNAGEAMMTGANMKRQELKQSREHLGALQEAMLQLKEEGQELLPSKNKGRKTAKNGLRIDYTDKAQMGFMIANQLGKRNTQNQLPTISLDTNDVYGDTTLSVAQRHNNPGNMKFESWMTKFGATPGNPDRITKDGTTYAQFPDMQSGMSAMREKLFNRPTFSKLTLKDAINRWTGNHPYANIPQDLANKPLNQMTPEEKERAFSVITMGEDSKVYNRIQPRGTAAKPESQAFIPQNIHFNPLTAPTLGATSPNTPAQNRQPYQYNWNLSEPKDIPVPTDAEPLQFQQILPELYAAATNKQEPVWMQQYDPQLFQDFEVSLQDRRNRITSQGRASRQYLGDNAGAQAILAAGEYDAISGVDAEEFRINQQISNDITNKNIGLLNDAKLKNLQLADQQYIRQATGKSKTKAANQAILNSLSNKVLQNQLENRTLQVYENLYPHFRYDDQYQLQKEGNSGADYLSLPSFTPATPTLGSNTSTQRTMDASGNLKQIRYSTPSSIKTSLDEIRLKEAREKTFGSEYKNLQRLFNIKK